jgi:long-chain acyl-CoA synthetase
LNVLEQVLDVTNRNRNRVFLIDAINDRQFSFKDFYDLSCSLAVKLRSRGARSGNRVAIVCRNSAELAVTYFSCLYQGITAVPVNPLLHQKEIDFILNCCEPRMVIYSPSTERLVTGLLSKRRDLISMYVIPRHEALEARGEADCWSIDSALHERADRSKPFDNVSPKTIFTITFTSGTTALPKGVAHRVESLIRNAMVFNEKTDVVPNNRFYNMLSMAYMAGFLNLLISPFLAGASVVISRTFDARAAIGFWRPVTKYEINAFWLVPTIMSILMKVDRDPEGPEYCRTHIDKVFVGTAPLPDKLRRDFMAKYGVQIWESYGLSETLIVSSNSRKTNAHAGSVGRVLPGTSLRIVDKDGIGLPPNREGEIMIRSPDLMEGYLDPRTSQPETLDPESWFPTGDIGYLSREGDLYITGRSKDLIIRGGINISPQSIENILLEHEAVERSAVISVPDEIYGEEIMAVLKLKTGFSMEQIIPSLRNLCRERLSPMSQPRFYRAVDELPLTSNGKVQKDKLRKLFGRPGNGAVQAD